MRTILIADSADFYRINKYLMPVNSLSGFKRACQRIGELDLSSTERRYYFSVIMKLAFATNIDWLKASKAKATQECKHPVFHLPYHSLWRAKFSLNALSFFNEEKCAEHSQHLSVKRFKSTPGDLIEYLYYHPDESIAYWRKAMMKKNIPLALWVQFADYLDRVKVVKEAREEIIHLEDGKQGIIAATHMINCHAIFIFHQKSPQCYAAHVNPSQAENRHFMFGSPVPSFTRVGEFVELVGSKSGFDVYVLDKKAFSEKSLKRLSKALKEAGVHAYSLQELTPSNCQLSAFRESEGHRYAIAYHVAKQSFFAVHKGEVFTLLDRRQSPKEMLTLLL